MGAGRGVGGPGRGYPGGPEKGPKMGVRAGGPPPGKIPEISRKSGPRPDPRFWRFLAIFGRFLGPARPPFFGHFWPPL